jgi:hypothetical protein
MIDRGCFTATSVACLRHTSVTAKNQKPNLRPKKNTVSRLLIWVISGFYLLAMVWFLLSAMGKYGAAEPQPWIASAVAGFTVAYGVLMMLLWRDEEATAQPPRR